MRWTLRSPSWNWPDFSAVKVMPPVYPPGATRVRAGGPGGPASGLQQDLHRAVLLLPEVGVGLLGVLERHPVAGEVVDAERVALGEDRQDVGHPAPDVGLPHAQLDL